MKFTIRLLIATALFLALPSVGAQTPSLRKPGQTTSKVTTSYLSGEFDAAIERLPANFNGHNLLQVFDRMRTAPPKGEFEKTDEYDARIAKWRTTPFEGRLTPSSLFAFKISPSLAPDAITITYDADREEMNAKISMENRYLASGFVRWLEAFYTSKNLGSRIGTTRMGVKFRVTSYAGSSLGLAFNDQLENIALNKSLPREVAVRVKDSIAALALVELSEPYKTKDSTEKSASLDDPQEWQTEYFGLRATLKAIWIYDTQSGEILIKSSGPFAKCRYDICA